MKAEQKGEHLPLHYCPLRSTDKACIMPSGKGKIFKGPRLIFTEQPLRLDLGLKGKLMTDLMSLHPIA